MTSPLLRPAGLGELERASTARQRAAPRRAGFAPPAHAAWDICSVLCERRPDGRPRYRLYHLAAPAHLDKAARDDCAKIWLAESEDLRTWVSRGPVIGPGAPGEQSDLAIWTGNVYRFRPGDYVAFVTGRNRRDGPLQYLFRAQSSDGVQWSLDETPLLEPPSSQRSPSRVFPALRDPEYHSSLGPLSGAENHLLLYTGQAEKHEIQPFVAGAHAPGAVCVAIAERREGPYRRTSPLLAPGVYDQMEVPQLIQRDGRYYLFFSAAEKDYAAPWSKYLGHAQTGLHCWVAESLDGPWLPLNGDGTVPGLGSESGLYGTKVLHFEDGSTSALGWHWCPSVFGPNLGDKAITPGAVALTIGEPLALDWSSGGPAS